ncbi:MAG TPA: ATPase [Allosphingosinicella sp.]|jgi:F-type H+-transporting ATPase subunit b
MPQIAQISEIFASQFFWLAIVFGLIYFVIGRSMLPRIEATVDARDARIAEDLAEAERARARADEIEETNRLETERSRGEALKVTQAAKDAAARDREARVKASDAETGVRVGAAETRIRSAADAALAEIETVAAEAAQDIVQRLSGAGVSREEAQNAVRAVLSNG